MRLEYFDLLETVEDLDYDKGSITVSGTLPTDGPVFEGHFPGHPLLPGVFMLEIMNHAAGYLLFSRHERKRFVFLGGVKRAKFRRFVTPGTKWASHADITYEGSGFAIAETVLRVGNGDVAADAEIIMILSDFPNEEVAEAMNQRMDLIKLVARTGT
jgi:3-hydroxyacyl-[acyl-carrier-protein] dehydratase